MREAAYVRGGSVGAGIYGWSSGQGGVHFFRIQEALRVAGLHGVKVGWGPKLDARVAEEFDTIVVHMLWQEQASEGWKQLATNGKHRMIFDIDDAMWSPDWKPFRNAYSPEVLTRLFRNLQMAHVVTTPSPVIAEYVAQYNPNVWVVQNTVPEYVLRMGRHRHEAGPIRPYPASSSINTADYILGYQGSPSHSTDFPLWLQRDIWESIRHHDDFGLHFWGVDKLDWVPRDVLLRTGCTPWQSDMDKYYNGLVMDIGLAPLKDTEFNRCKSGLRAIEYMALGIPGIYSAGPAYSPWVKNGRNGILMGRGDSWSGVLHELMTDHELRFEMAANCRMDAAEWSTEERIGDWVEAWNSVER